MNDKSIMDILADMKKSLDAFNADQPILDDEEADYLKYMNESLISTARDS